MSNLFGTSSPTWRIADLADQIRLVFARRERFPCVRRALAPSRTHGSLARRIAAKFIVILRYALHDDDRIIVKISWYCHRVAHTSRASYTRAQLRDPTYLYFLTVLHAHLPPGKRTIRGTVCAVTLFVKHLYWRLNSIRMHWGPFCCG